ncbi:MAG: DUF533 domain-containing protein [Desulfovibrio sp.]|nr:DUF533 domain-containing protein [Desulfovibrio sp.]
MGLFDILTNPEVRQVLTSLAGKAGDGLQQLNQKIPQGMGGLAGAGALGALLGSVLPRGVAGAAGMLGVGAIAWNFYQKWAKEKGITPNAFFDAKQGSQQAAVDPVALQLLRAMIFAARADGHIDATEQKRIELMVGQLFPNQDVQPVMAKLMEEAIDPSVLAKDVVNQEQADDLFRLSCVIVDIDHFMEESYFEALGKALHIDANRQQALMAEAKNVKAELAKFA